MNRFLRTEALIGAEGLSRLQAAHVAVAGIGGVGGATLEGLVRAGVGRITVIDGDRIAETNCNRQFLALSSTIGREKTAAAQARMLDINPRLKLTLRQGWIRQDTIEQLLPEDFTFLADCVDDVDAKLLMAQFCRTRQIPLIMCMGTGNRLTSAGLQIANFDRTAGCPLAKKMRTLLKKEQFRRVRCLYSPDPLRPAAPMEEGGRQVIGSISYVPAIAGMKLAEHIVGRILSGETDPDIPR